jgi:glycosyltransferase involved in cell wall biosynthesis
MEMLTFLENTDNVTVVTDNHLACDIPNEYETILVHHGVAQTHADREPEWDEYWKKLCCEGQKKMLYHRDPKTTKILSISQFCTDEFTKYYGDDYTQFDHKMILHTSELNDKIYKRQWNKIPVILGNWPCVNKGRRIVDQLSMSNNRYTFKQLSVRSNGPREVDIIDFNRRKQRIYIDSDLFLNVSLCEGFSYSALDALLCGIPVVSSDVGLFYRDIPDDCFVKLNWTRMNDIDYVKDKIEYAIKHKETIGRKGREWYLTNCRFDKWSDNVVSYIN